MTMMMKKSGFTIGLLFVLLALPAYGASMNESVKIAAGGKSGGASALNGSITVGENAVVSGGIETVNGSISVYSGASVENASTVNGRVKLADDVNSHDLETVNGAIDIGSSATVDGGIQAVNGAISVGSRSSVAEGVSNVNGEIKLDGAKVGGDVSTISGDVNLANSSVVGGDIIVEKPSSWGVGDNSNRKPRVVIGPGSEVAGAIVLGYEVELFISQTAKVGGVEGVMSMDDAIRFSGDRP